MESRHKDKLRRQGKPLQPTEVLVPTIDPTDLPRPGAATNQHTAQDHTAHESTVTGNRRTIPVQQFTIGSDGGQTQHEFRAETTVRAAMDRAAAVQRLAEDLPAELQDMLLMCDTPTALVALAVSLTNTLSVMELLVDDLCARGLLTIDQIPVAPRHGQHWRTA
jgi:hypothetical protein